MRWYKSLWATSFLLFWQVLTAQQMIYDTYTMQDGLVANPARRIYQDAKGFIWIATWEGLSKYDGNKFTNYSLANGLSHNMVNDIREIDNKLLVLLNDGSIDAVEENGNIRNVFKGISPFNRFVPIGQDRLYITTDYGGIYVSTNGKIFKPDQTTGNISNGNLLFIQDSLLIGGSGNDINLFNLNFDYLTHFTRENIEFHNFFYGFQDQILAGTNHGIREVRLKKGQPDQIQLLPIPERYNFAPLNNSIINDCLFDKKGNCWIASSRGLVKIGKDGRKTVFTESHGLPSSNVTCIFLDRENNLWIGTSLGVVKLPGENSIRIFNINTKLIPQAPDSLILLPSGTLINFSSRYLKKPNDIWFHDSFFLKAKNGPGLSKIPYIFIGGSPVTYDRIMNKVSASPIFRNRNLMLFCAAKDGQGNIWVGTNCGLFLVNENQILYDTSLPIRISSMIVDSKGFLWVGSWNMGLFRIAYTINKNKIDWRIEELTGLINSREIRNIYEDREGNVWIGTRYLGVARLKQMQGKWVKNLVFDQGAGLLSNWVKTIAEDPRGHIWIGSNLGLDKLVKQDSGYYVFNFSRVYNFYSDIYSVSIDSSGSGWCLGDKLISFSDEQLEKSYPLQVYITKAELGLLKDGKITRNDEKSVKLNYTQNNAKFEFSAPGFINEKQILYSYRLLGSSDTSWSIPRNIHDVSYASLQPGNYIFQARTIGWNGQPGHSANFAFTIQHPFWETWWFYLLIFASILSLFFGIYKYRIQQMMQVQKVRNRIATDLHDDIGSTLTNISILSEISNKKLNEPEQARIFLQRISEEVTSTGQALDDIIWSVNSHNDTLEETLARMRRYAAELFDNSPTRCQIDEEVLNIRMKLNMELRRDIFLLYKEALNNAFKHAQAMQINVRISVENSELLLKIFDNGKGFDTTSSTHRNGLKNMRVRTEKWNGNFSIFSEAGKGTTITIRLPV